MWNKTQKKPIAAFLALTFLIAWGGELLLILMERLFLLSLPDAVRSFITFGIIGVVCGMAPLYATAILLKKYRQISGFKDFFSRVMRQRSTMITITFTLLFGAVMVAENILANNWLGEGWYMVIAALPLMVIGGGLEEIGWRGFLQPALEEKISFVPSALVVGIVWAVWHYPAWLVQGANQSDMNIVSFTLSCITLSFVLSAVYKSAKSVFACVIMHAFVNALGVIFSLNYITDAPNLKIMLIFLAVICLSIFVCYVTDSRKSKKFA